MKPLTFLFLLPVAVMWGFPLPSARACIWDSETMEVEKAHFPEALSILTGDFPRHSARFHEWRIAKTTKALKTDPANPALYDDLAVSQHKLGKHREAIATMQQKEAAVPGRYETYSNLGTFYIYTGELKEAVVFIDKALSINPDAHFGREKYQRWLVLWLMERQTGAVEPETATAHQEATPRGFARFILQQQQPAGTRWTEEDRAPAIKGILGMMRFADFDNPLLQEALGDVLLSGDWAGNSMTNAAFSYRIACTKATKASEKQRLFGKFQGALGALNERWNPKRAGEEVKRMLAKGTALQAKVQKDEAAWLAAGKDLSAEFNKKYLAAAKTPAPAKATD